MVQIDGHNKELSWATKPERERAMNEFLTTRDIKFILL